MSEEYPYNGRLSRWEEIAEGLAIVGVQAIASPFPFNPGQYATLGLMGPEKLIQRPMSISSSADRLDEYEFFIRLVHNGEFTPLLGVGNGLPVRPDERVVSLERRHRPHRTGAL